jgi:hypothetical protein
MKPKISDVLDAAADGCMARYQVHDDGFYRTDETVGSDPMTVFGREYIESRRLSDMLRSMAVVFRSAGE